MSDEIVATLKTPDGQVFTYLQEVNNSDHIEFLWTEGNYGCDCNRSLFAIDSGVMENELECNSGEPAIELLSLTVNGQEILNQ